MKKLFYLIFLLSTLGRAQSLTLSQYSSKTNEGFTLGPITATQSGFSTTPTYQWTQINQIPSTNDPVIITNANTRSAKFTSSQAGVYTFRCTAKNNVGQIATADFVLIVIPGTNIPPMITIDPNQTVYAPVTDLPIKIAISDLTDTVKYTWLQSPTNPTQVTLPPQKKTLPIEEKHLDTLKLSNLSGGVYIFSLLAIDERGGNTTVQIAITVIPILNKLPYVAKMSDITLVLPQDSTLLTGIASDTDGTISKYLWTQEAGPSQAKIADAGTYKAMISGLKVGNYTFKFTVTDDKNATAFESVNVIVKPRPNQKPEITLPSLITLELPKDSVTLTASVTDPDGDPVDMRWTQTYGATLTAKDSVSVEESQYNAYFVRRKLRLNNLKAGEYRFRLTVSDNYGGTAYGDVTVKVNSKPNTPPVVSLPKDTILIAPVASFLILSSASDPDGDPLTYQWTLLESPSGMNLQEANNGKNGKMENMALGKYKVQLKVSDGKGGEQTAVMEILVEAGDLSRLKAHKVLSPNGDGQNETWSIDGLEYFPELNVTVINEQGKVVYNAQPYTRANEWDGKTNGKDLPEGAYFYLIRDNNNKIIQKGSLLLVR
jgi:gliding motility-associated-like protein